MSYSLYYHFGPKNNGFIISGNKVWGKLSEFLLNNYSFFHGIELIDYELGRY